MFKKVLLASAMLAISSSIAYADATPYAGGSLGFGGYKSQPGVIGNIFGGYGTTLGMNQKFYLGGEINANVGHYSNYNTTYGLGASLLPGIMLSKYTMIYGRAGLNSVYTPHKIGTTNFGTQLGLGLQTNLMNNWDVRGEYVHSNIQNTGQYNLGLLYKFN